MPRKAKAEKQEEAEELAEAEEKTEKVSKKETKTEEKEEAKPEKKKLTEAEFEKKVLELAERKLTSEKIGETLRKEGIHPKEYSKKISVILKEKNKYTVPELKNVEEKLERIKKHYDKNKQDRRSMRERERVFAQLRLLKKYFKVAIK